MMKHWKLILPLFAICIFNFVPSYAQVMMNGTIIGIDNGNVTVLNPITVDSMVAGSGITTRATDSDELRTFSFDRVNHTAPYSIGLTGISSSRIDFSILSSGLTDARTTTNGSQLSEVRLNGATTGFSFSNSLNTIIVNSATTITEFLTSASNGGGMGIPLSAMCGTGVFDPVTSSCVFGPVGTSNQTARTTGSQTSNDQFMTVSIFLGISITVIVGMLIFRYLRQRPRFKNATKSGSDSTINKFNKNIRRKD